MKKGILYLFLITYTTVMLKPVLPYLSDLVAHVLFFKDHMQTVHAHQGKFHAHAAVAEGAKNDLPEKNTGNFKKDKTGTEHTIIKRCDLSFQKEAKHCYQSIAISTITRNIQCDYPPPKRLNF